MRKLFFSLAVLFFSYTGSFGQYLAIPDTTATATMIVKSYLNGNLKKFHLTFCGKTAYLSYQKDSTIIFYQPDVYITIRTKSMDKVDIFELNFGEDEQPVYYNVAKKENYEAVDSSKVITFKEFYEKLKISL